MPPDTAGSAGQDHIQGSAACCTHVYPEGGICGLADAYHGEQLGIRTHRFQPGSDSAAQWIYGAAHIEDGKLLHHTPYGSREVAEQALRDCRHEGADCYLARAPRNPWERVPDGE